MPIRCRVCDRVRFDDGAIKYWPRTVQGERWGVCPKCVREANEAKWRAEDEVSMRVRRAWEDGTMHGPVDPFRGFRGEK